MKIKILIILISLLFISCKENKPVGIIHYPTVKTIEATDNSHIFKYIINNDKIYTGYNIDWVTDSVGKYGIGDTLKITKLDNRSPQAKFKVLEKDYKKLLKELNNK